jgi:hypothetical protein
MADIVYSITIPMHALVFPSRILHTSREMYLLAVKGQQVN